MATFRTGILNTSGDVLTLPPPYAGILGAGQQAVVADSAAVVLAALGGSKFAATHVVINTLPTTTPLTPHGLGIGLPRAFSTIGNTGAGGVTFASAKVGDAVLEVSSVTGGFTGGDLTSSFESSISVAGQIQQVATNDLSKCNVLIILIAKS